MFQPRIPIAAITDEFSPTLRMAISPMKEIGMTGAELRVVDGKNIMDLSADEMQRAKDTLDTAGLKVVSISSPVLKCVLPNGPALDERFQHDIFASKHKFEDQERLTERSVTLAHFFNAPIVRVFSYWRTVEPAQCFPAISEALTKLADVGARENICFALENEHACNVGTASEAAAILHTVKHGNLGLVWDPANALVAGEEPMPDGFARLPFDRIVHVHAKDCHMEGNTPVWGPLGTRRVRWKEQVKALLDGSYQGFISLETHWRGPNDDKLEASRICGWNLRGLAAA